MQSSEGKCKAQMSISYGGPVLWNLNEENEAEKDIFLVDGAPCWHLVRSVTSALLFSALTCNHSTSVVIFIYIAIVIVISVVITKISIIILIIVIITFNNQKHQECIALDALMQL